jgi:chromosomal replication initiator protein
VILREVAQQYGVSVEDIISARRHQKVVRPRQIVMYRLCYETDWSLPRIGRLLGDRDHTTVLNGRRKIERLIAAGEVTL